MVSVLFVCLGNICRSPLAQGVFERYATEAGLAVRADSAGTGDWHIGSPPDSRSIAVAARHGFDISSQRARQVQPADFTQFDHIIAMDYQNLWTLEARAPAAARERIKLLMPFAELPHVQEVPDPYSGTDGDFEHVLSLVEQGIAGLIAQLRG